MKILSQELVYLWHWSLEAAEDVSDQVWSLKWQDKVLKKVPLVFVAGEAQVIRHTCFLTRLCKHFAAVSLL